MLELKNIRKVYKTGDESVEALKGVSLKFRESEFVSILGQSGCGKTTLLNIIGGLDRYTSGDLIINGKSTKQFKDKDWDAYRNYKVGFVFQSYNLIGHQTILSNVELALTIGGISKKERRERAIKALTEVGLADHLNKKPNQLSGGQMQRVAIARALVNDPDIILADEPTGALDTKTSIQVMEILKTISKDKLIVMVTHNPELAEEYSSRVIRILDGEIIEDTNPIADNESFEKKSDPGIGKTKMSFLTAFRLSLNNLLTKKARTILIAFAGSIGIIGIALIQATSNGFQNYVDHIQEDTLSSYPLSIMQESTDITSMLLAMRSSEGEATGDNKVIEKQYISNVLSSISTNDLPNFIKYVNDHYSEIEKDISTIKYTYSVDPLIYSKNKEGELMKLNPSNLFTSMMGDSSLMSSYSSMSSVYSQMIDDRKSLESSYEVLSGRWPQKYNEVILVLSQPNAIPDLLVYSLGLRDNDELTDMVQKIMSGESVNVKNDPMEFTYEDLMNVDLRLIRPTDTYKYNSEYKVYEDFTEDKDFMNNLFDTTEHLKIVGIVTAKEGASSSALSPGVAYTSDLINYIIDYSADSDIVKAQLADKDIDVISGKRFDDKDTGLGLQFSDLVSVDNNKITQAFGGGNAANTEQKIKDISSGYMGQISDAVTTDITPAKTMFNDTLTALAKGLFKTLGESTSTNKAKAALTEYMNSAEATGLIKAIYDKFNIPVTDETDFLKTTYTGILGSMLDMGIKGIRENAMDPGLLAAGQPKTTDDSLVPLSYLNVDLVLTGYNESALADATATKVATAITEGSMKTAILTKVGSLVGDLSMTFADSVKVNPELLKDAFQLSMSEEQITRVISSMMTKTDKNAKTNLISFGYQVKDEPTYLSFYFTSFDNKEHFLSFLDGYNKMVKENGEEDKEIRYSDTTGILMGSVKTIVNAVTYVLIAFVSISLVVSSFMIGIITYISVYERTKEIGILRAIGASKRNISSIFNAETFIIGLLSGLLGIGISYALIPVINIVLHNFIGKIPLDVVLNWENAAALIVLSIILTLIGGLIPARSASKKDPVIALRTE